MVSTRQMEELIRKVLERGGKVLLVGDTKQLQPIEAGNPFRAISHILGEARLSKIIRQRKEEDRLAVQHLSRGDADKAFESYVSRNLLHIGDTPKASMEKLISDWKNEAVLKRKASLKENLIICGTNAERSELNKMAQAEMRKAGKLGRKAVTVNGEDFHRGDRITFTRNAGGLGVTNGSSGTIQRIGTKRITRKTYHGKRFTSLWSFLKYSEQIKKDKSLWITVKLDDGKVVDIPLERYQDFRLGYAQNTHASQGRTVDNVFILTGGPTLDREMIYVQASRARNSPNIYAGALRKFSKRQKDEDTIANLSKRASKSRAKELAHDLEKRTEKQKLHLRPHL
jgi:ATP-dependent exoDNAse (exonuclease V) alpha subunit